MNAIKAWFLSKNITAHTVAAVLVSAAILISSDQQVQQFLVDLLKAHPALAADVLLLAGIIAKYSRSSSAAGAMATARNIAAQPDAPTSSQVDAASTTKP